ncbi:unnamed protein product [Enterobius vermicularis]|uniref:SGNH hydrolase-type esterase domain-containing protein n=1 Tax=Enterobius vermicularis TaxID=51028 RepID=A0A3P6IFK0_ENTVE|nr:unnamed protein product [Enterobius vermicularis]
MYHFTPFANTVDEFLLYYGRTKFSVCESLTKKSKNSTFIFAFLRNYWIAAVGDSFASGEGNPDVPAKISTTSPAQWLSEQCHRSSRSWAFKVYQKLVNGTKQAALHFSYLPCSGASVDNGIVSSSFGEPQGSGPELLLISAGGNDIGYSEILSKLSWGETRSLFSSIDMRFFYVSHQLDKLAAKVREIKPKQVIIPHYFDLSRNEKGIVDANCSELKQISTKNLVLAERKILKRINKLISQKAREQSWTVIDNISAIFRFRGLCSTKPLIRSTKDSLRLQGNIFGAFHPTEEAHQQIAELILKQIKSFQQK